MVARGLRVIYLHGLAGAPAVSPAIEAVRAAGIDVVTPVLPGFDGASGFEAPGDHLGWLTLAWDTLDATGALPCPVVAASVGGMLAAELAALRPEVVTALALLAPLGLWDDALTTTAVDPFGVPTGKRLDTLFARDVPAAFTTAFEDRGPEEQPVAQYLAWTAAASLVWPLPDHGLAARLHRITCPTLVVWGDADQIAPPALADLWPGEKATIPGAGHLLEWDEPEATATVLLDFLQRPFSTQSGP